MMFEVEPPVPDGPAPTRLLAVLDTRSEHPVVQDGLPGQDECMIDDPSPEPRDSGTPSAQAPESYFWPLVALVLVILPQVLVPGRMREGPPLIVPVIEAAVFLGRPDDTTRIAAGQLRRHVAVDGAAL